MSKKPVYGPDNPHPLSTMSTELVWEGKYDEYGHRREVDIAGLSMPRQKIETIDQPRSEAAAKGVNLDLFEKENTRLDDFRNMLIWGDNKLVMASLLKEYKGKIDLIYIDPPFDVGADFRMNIPIGDNKETIGKDQSTLEMVAYRDTWGRGLHSYLSMIYQRFQLMLDLLAENGVICVHIGSNINHLVRGILDDVFGMLNFRNEIIVKRGVKNVQQQFESIDALMSGYDTILFYSKSESKRFPHLRKQLEQTRPGTWNNHWRGTDRPTMRYELFGATPERGQWRWSKQRTMEAVENYKIYEKKYASQMFIDEYYILVLETEGKKLDFVRLGSTGKPEHYVPPTDTQILNDIWLDFPAYQRSNYPTQKSKYLLERIIKWLSEKGGFVADFFCGSGTTGAVAERLGRRWIMADLGRFAIHTSRKRLIGLQRQLHDEGKPYRAFDVYNLGRYERQWWQKEYLDNADAEHRRVVLEFFRAEVLDKTPSPLIHGRKSTSFCHVDGIDSIFTREEARAVAKAVAQAGGRECYCLAWEFEMDLHLTTAALRNEFGIKLKLIQIPREIMEKNRRDPPPFLEVAVLEARPVYRGKGSERSVDIKLTKFMPSLAEVPAKEIEAIKERALRSGMDFIDFWAVDFDWQPGQPFNHHWQDYRTRKDRSLKTISEAEFKFSKPGRYTACVKVVDTFGCDTSITVEIEV